MAPRSLDVQRECCLPEIAAIQGAMCTTASKPCFFPAEDSSMALEVPHHGQTARTGQLSVIELETSRSAKLSPRNIPKS